MTDKTWNKGGLTLFAAVMMVLTLVAGLFAGPAATQAAPSFKVEPPHVVSIPANGKVTLKARGFCIDFGKPFPTGAMAPNGLAAANIRGALTYAIDKGYADGNAQQVQLAIWNLRDNIWHNDSHAVASEIVSNTTTTTPPTSDALMLTDAMTQKSVDVSAQFVPQTADAFYGDGNVVITNTTAAALNVYMPIGVVFTVPNGAGAFQDLVSYELVQAEGTPTAGATSVATGTVAAASVTPAASATVGATGTALATVTSAATVESTATTAVATVEPTMTEAPTVEVATATTVPVNAPLPSTGGGSDSGLLVALIVALGLSMAGLGLAMRRKKA
jgi:LPXTG-motif cell wall-anchored protein